VDPVLPDVIVYVCANSVPRGGRLPRQWSQDGAHVLVREVPCSGKTDGQYLMHGLEGGAHGLCVVACPKGRCQLAQGNYRAEIRIGTVRRLLAEIGLEPERAQFLHSSPDDPADRLHELVREAVGRICALGPSPIRRQAEDATVEAR
jgi:coenzyme F420-reducing hydrogenase delta subunit